MPFLDRISIIFIDKPLFLKKITVVFVATSILVPFVYFKLYVPATLYIIGLLILHLVFLYTYFFKVAWRQLLQNKLGFALRILAICLFVYLLAVLKFQGSFSFVIANLFAGLAIHTLILFALMAEIRVATTK